MIYCIMFIQGYNMNIEIRKAKPEEAKSIIDINIKVWATTYANLIPIDIIKKVQVKDEKIVKNKEKRLRKSQDTIVALVDSKIVGYHSITEAKNVDYENCGEICEAYILDDYQGLGLGRKLTIECMKELLSQGYTSMVTKCLVGNPANEFHKSIGGVFVKEMPISFMDIWTGKENLYYHENLQKRIASTINLSI